MAGHKGQVVGYVRVSAPGQNEARQLKALGAVDRLFSEKVSGKKPTTGPSSTRCSSASATGTRSG